MLAGSVQVSTGTKTSLSFQDGPVFTRVHRREGRARLRLDRFYRATRELGPRLQDRVHPRLPEPAGASHADPTRAPQGRTATRPRPVRPLRPTGSARLRSPNRRGELPASHPRSYHLLADSGDRSCFERGGLGWPDDLNFELLSHISPIGWDNVLLYGELRLSTGSRPPATQMPAPGNRRSPDTRQAPRPPSRRAGSDSRGSRSGPRLPRRPHCQ